LGFFGPCFLIQTFFLKRKLFFFLVQHLEFFFDRFELGNTFIRKDVHQVRDFSADVFQLLAHPLKVFLNMSYP